MNPTTTKNSHAHIMADHADPELSTEAPEGLTEYEAQRLQLIARNRARLMALGIPSAVEGLSILAPPPKKQHARWVQAISSSRPVQPAL